MASPIFGIPGFTLLKKNYKGRPLSEPCIYITPESIYFNRAFGITYANLIKTYITFFISSDNKHKLGMSFKNDKGPEDFKVTRLKQTKAFKIVAVSIYNQISKMMPKPTNVYKVEYDERINIWTIDLKNPFVPENI
jgi:aromatic ring-opening dioxygenase LigB subunit